MKSRGGNGSGKFDIHQQDMGGWVRVYSDRNANLPDDFGLFLSTALTEWFRQHPHLILRCVTPIQRDGDTVELHAWYEAHLFVPLGGPTPSDKT